MLPASSDRLSPVVSNRLMASLPDDVRARLRPHLSRVTLRAGEVLYSPGARVRHAYFPTSSMVCLQYSTREGASVEIGVVGTDGVVGIAPVLGEEPPAHHAIVQIGGDALRIDAATLAGLVESSEPLRRALFRYAHVLMTQMGQVAVCNSVHTLQQRVCRWLLVCRDRLGSIEIPATQGVLGEPSRRAPRKRVPRGHRVAKRRALALRAWARADSRSGAPPRPPSVSATP